MSAAAELIRDHARHPVGRSDSSAAVVGRAELITPTCGDRLEVRVTGTPSAVGVAWSGRGCEVSQGSASLMADELDGRSASEIRGRIESFLASMERREAEAGSGQESALLAVAGNPVRSVCATLAWRALRAALEAGELR
ncbi:SUF system NifU family Fe-S cluster assembly protein [Rathayibacter sp. VKM Ac-2803]|uniref:iron-sulfur cluster assembly scaffold protein n=1 Tax=unclassified Rathayibacter TaxID=2609250 RepID=UPI00135C23CD|nr:MULTISPECIES: iron-sulfur cluster assembly scaffold protein [unclassified Rathayibacter]MWV50195.1 SUF system NifU family Fe-S cluster assembly protein [Rathayibacter sp. VKM Ac-2803]MWV58275.1 SUF system NifU family Fe-S cluster assembly protein [Rathayibacter sp. VKM Ac-2754]